MSELTNPLGQKPEKPPARKKPRGSLLPVISLVIGILAIGFVAYDRFFPGEDENSLSAGNKNQPTPGEQIDFSNEPASKEADSQAGNEELENLSAEDGSGEENDIENGSGLEEIELTGEMVTPKVVPTPSPVRKGQEAGTAHLPDPDLIEKGATGVIPKRGEDGRRPMDVYAREPDTTGNFGVARVVLIVGGIGISQTSSQEAIRDLPPAVTLAFAPYGNSRTRWMQEARKKGHELLLQLPMEPHGYPQNNPGIHTLRTGVSAEENIANLHWLMSRVTNYVGVMNYLGGKFSNDKSALKPVFNEIADRGLLYVDDGSIGNSQSEIAARSSLLPYARGHIQIDTVRTRQEISRKLQELANEAKRTGIAIGVANAFPDSIKMIAEFAKQASSNGIEITPVSAIVDDPQENRQ